MGYGKGRYTHSSNDQSNAHDYGSDVQDLPSSEPVQSKDGDELQKQGGKMISFCERLGLCDSTCKSRTYDTEHVADVVDTGEKIRLVCRVTGLGEDAEPSDKPVDEKSQSALSRRQCERVRSDELT
jgi:hypothetical protein